MLALIVGLVIGVNWAGGRSPSQPTVPATSRPITAMRFSSPDAGWVLSLGELLATRSILSKICSGPSTAAAVGPRSRFGNRG